MRVIVTGRLKQRTFDDKESQRRTTVEVDAEEIAASLTYARATVTKTYGPGPAARTGPRSEPGPRLHGAGPGAGACRAPPVLIATAHLQHTPVLPSMGIGPL